MCFLLYETCSFSAEENANERNRQKLASRLRCFFQEIDLMESLRERFHVNVVSLFGVVYQDFSRGTLSAVLELCAGGSLLKYVRKSWGYSTVSSNSRSVVSYSSRSHPLEDDYIETAEVGLLLIYRASFDSKSLILARSAGTA